MKKILLLSGISAIGVAAFAADVPEPSKLEDAYIQCLSPNGKYAVSNINTDALSIYNFETGEVFRYSTTSEYDPEQYVFGLGKCISDNGVFVGGRSDASAEYWKNGEWHSLNTAGRDSFSNAANAISRDGGRICGIIGSGEVSYDNDVLMVEPCIWNSEGEGYGEPVILPYPERDILGSVPMYVKAIDISADGKIVIGEVVVSNGMLNYPILYKEDADGNWSYEIPHIDLLMPEGLVLPENPGTYYTGEFPFPNNYMTDKESEAYSIAIEKYYNGELDEEPDCLDYMSGELKERYIAVKADYDEWEKKFNAWNEALAALLEYCPSYQDNSVRISSDGLTYGCTISKGSGSPWGGGTTKDNVWIFDVNSDNITKYDQQDNLCLSYLADGGIAFASTPTSMFKPSNSFVLKDGEVTGMYEWMNFRMPEYASWMKDNMEFEYTGIDEEWNPVSNKEFMTGHAISTPDVSMVALSVLNIGFPEDDEVWEDPDYTPIIGYGFIFDFNVGSAVEAVRPAAEGNVIYDLSGRQLKEAGAPGIYIINGEKKVVR